MSIRIRKDNKTMVCAAKSKPMDGDFYVDDALHHQLAGEMGVISVYGYTEGGCDLWEFHPPMTIGEIIKKEELAISNIVSIRSQIAITKKEDGR